MNNILQLKGQFQKRKAPSGFGPTNLPKGKSVSAEHVLKLKNQLQDIILFWNQEKTINGALVSVHYRKVVAKSNRLQLLKACVYLFLVYRIFAEIGRAFG